MNAEIDWHGKGHRMNECEYYTIECVNCLSVSRKYKINLNVNNMAISRDCYVYKDKLEIEWKKVEFVLYNSNHWIT